MLATREMVAHMSPVRTRTRASEVAVLPDVSLTHLRGGQRLTRV